MHFFPFSIPLVLLLQNYISNSNYYVIQQKLYIIIYLLIVYRTGSVSIIPFKVLTSFLKIFSPKPPAKIPLKAEVLAVEIKQKPLWLQNNKGDVDSVYQLISKNIPIIMFLNSIIPTSNMTIWNQKTYKINDYSQSYFQSP